MIVKPCKAKAWFEKPKRKRNPETNRSKKQRGAKCLAASSNAADSSIHCALCSGVLPEVNMDEFASQCIVCNRWFCHGIGTDCAQSMTTDEEYNPLCAQCAV